MCSTKEATRGTRTNSVGSDTMPCHRNCKIAASARTGVDGASVMTRSHFDGGELFCAACDGGAPYCYFGSWLTFWMATETALGTYAMRTRMRARGSRAFNFKGKAWQSQWFGSAQEMGRTVSPPHTASALSVCMTARAHVFESIHWEGLTVLGRFN